MRYAVNHLQKDKTMTASAATVKMSELAKLPVVFSTEQADQDAVILVDDEKNTKKIDTRIKL